MTRALVTQLLEALELHAKQYPHMQKGYTVDAITAARAYLATEPSGVRSVSAQWLREFADMEFSQHSTESKKLNQVADMLEADAQQAKRVPEDEPEEDLYALALKADNWGQP